MASAPCPRPDCTGTVSTNDRACRSWCCDRCLGVFGSPIPPPHWREGYCAPGDFTDADYEEWKRQSAEVCREHAALGEAAYAPILEQARARSRQ